MDAAATGGSWTLPGYELGPVLGKGGFSTVYRARQLSLDRDVAIKILNTDLATPADQRRFDRERTLLADLSTHPGVVDIYDAGITPERRPFLVMRLYHGGTLADRLARHGPLPVDDVVDVITTIAAALDAAHAAGVVHRDVKPENILLTGPTTDDPTGRPALADFGIAGITDPDGTHARTHTSTTFFTLAHVAPEVLEGHRHSIASDVYALATTTYQLLTGRPPFDPRDPRVASHILDTPPPAITTPGIPPDLATTVTAALAKDPAHRPATAGSYATALTRALGTETTITAGGNPPAPSRPPAAALPGADAAATSRLPAPPPTLPAAPAPRTPGGNDGRGGERDAGQLPGRVRRLVTRPRLLIPVLAALTVVTALVVIAVVQSRRPGLREVELTSTTLSKDCHGALALSAYGTALATGDSSGVCLWDPTTGTRVGRPPSGVHPHVLALSPDGTTLAIDGSYNTVQMWDLILGTRIGQALAGHTGPVRTMAWSPDGATIATGGADGTMRVWDARPALRGSDSDPQTGQPKPAGAQLVQSVVWSPDSKHLASASVGDDSVRLWNTFVGTGYEWPSLANEIDQLPTGRTPGVSALAWSPDGTTLAIASSPGTVRLWNPTTGTQTGRTLTAGTDTVQAIAWSPDGTILATGNASDLRLWDPTTGTQIGHHTSDANAMAWLPDDQTLATAGNHDGLQLWHIKRR